MGSLAGRTGLQTSLWPNSGTAAVIAGRHSRMFALYTRRADQPRTFDNQKLLPRLPVPKLSETLDKYIKSVKPLLYEEARLAGKSQSDTDAFVKSKITKLTTVAEEFSSDTGFGRVLQGRLIDVDRTSPNNWLDDNFWTRVAYHASREPLPVNSNWWVNCAHDPDVPRSVTQSRPSDGEFSNWQVRRGAVLAWRLLDFKDRLERQELIPDSSRAGPFDMHQYTRVFGVTRIPGIPEDRLIVPPFPNKNKHIAVIVRDQIFILNTRDDKGKLKSKDALEVALWMIVHDVRTHKADWSPAVAVLTGTGRDSWAKAREHLLSLSRSNRSNLNAIEDSLFVVALDDFTRQHPNPHHTSVASELTSRPPVPAESEEDSSSLELDSHIRNSCAGWKGHNRWFDKSVCVSVESNSRASVVGEHSPCDALIPGIIVDYMLAEGLGKPKGPRKDMLSAGQSKSAAEQSEDSITLEHLDIKRLTWTTDETIKQAIQQAEDTVEDIVQDSDGLMLWFDEYGADWIKKQGKLSPDAYIQMAMQLAYRRMHGRGTSTYETASSRLFMHGRTDTIRTYSEESQRWVEAVVAGSSEDATLYKMLYEAVQAHNNLTREASTGRGCDRHLLGLRLCQRKGESHEIFQDPLFSASQEWKLSTSGLSAGDRFFGTGFGSPHPDGYGINYLAGAEMIKFGMESKRSSKETDTHKFRLAIVEAMRDMRRICENGGSEALQAGDKSKAKL